MRIVLLCSLLLGGCSVMDRIADSGPAPRNLNRVYLGHDVVRVRTPKQMDRYTCGPRPAFCENIGTMWECRCRTF